MELTQVSQQRNQQQPRKQNSTATIISNIYLKFSYPKKYLRSLLAHSLYLVLIERVSICFNWQTELKVNISIYCGEMWTTTTTNMCNDKQQQRQQHQLLRVKKKHRSNLVTVYSVQLMLAQRSNWTNRYHFPLLSSLFSFRAHWSLGINGSLCSTATDGSRTGIALRWES